MLIIFRSILFRNGRDGGSSLRRGCSQPERKICFAQFPGLRAYASSPLAAAQAAMQPMVSSNICSWQPQDQNMYDSNNNENRHSVSVSVSDHDRHDDPTDRPAELLSVSTASRGRFWLDEELFALDSPNWVMDMAADADFLLSAPRNCFNEADEYNSVHDLSKPDQGILPWSDIF